MHTYDVYVATQARRSAAASRTAPGSRASRRRSGRVNTNMSNSNSHCNSCSNSNSSSTIIIISSIIISSSSSSIIIIISSSSSSRRQPSLTQVVGGWGEPMSCLTTRSETPYDDACKSPAAASFVSSTFENTNPK